MLRKTFVVLVCSIPMCLYAASFDCSKAKLTTEKAICNDSYLSGLDESVASAYKSALQSTDDVSTLKTSQMAWIVQTRSCNATQDINECLVEKYSARLAELRSLSQIKSADAVEAKPVVAEPIASSSTEQRFSVTLPPNTSLQNSKSQPRDGQRDGSGNDLLSAIIALVITLFFGLSAFFIRRRSFVGG